MAGYRQSWLVETFLIQDSEEGVRSWLDVNRSYCAWRDRVVHQRMNAKGFLLPYDLFSWNKLTTVRYLNMVTWSTITIYIQNGSCSQYYTLCARWVLVVMPDSSSSLPGCYMRVLHPSSAADQLLILLPAWRAGPSPIPLPRVDPISLRVHAPTRSLVGYTYSFGCR